MTPDFSAAIKTVLKHEGGFVNDPDDPGGATNWGISLRFLKGQGLEVGDVDHDGDIDADDILKMSQSDAIAIYRQAFWVKNGYGSFPDHRVAAKTFDLCVNMGPRQAHKILQRAINAARGQHGYGTCQ